MTKKNIIDRPGMYLNKWATFLGLSQTYNIQLFIVNELPEPTVGGHDTAAEMEWQPPYRKAALRLTREIVTNYDDLTLERTILHELVHLVLRDIQELIDQTAPESTHEAWKGQLEDTCDIFTRYLLRLEYPDLDEMVEAQVEDPDPKAKGK